MTELEQLNKLLCTFEPEDKQEVVNMVTAARDYVTSVINMLAESRNYYDRTGQDLRAAKESSDRERTSCHNALIDRVNLVNRLCGLYGLEPIYTGSEARREYGDFAIALVDALYASRYD